MSGAVPDNLIEVIKRIVYDVSYDLAGDQGDFDKSRAAFDLVEACVQAQPDLLKAFKSARDDACHQVHEDCSDELVEPLNLLVLPGDRS